MVVTRYIQVPTEGNSEVVNITPRVSRESAASGVLNGTVTLFVAGSTAALTTIEFEPGVVSDFRDFWTRNAPTNIVYKHDQTWGDGNGHAHVRASAQGPSLTVPVVHGNLILGTWQQLVLVDFDIRPRTREVILQFMGEGKAAR
jgi:secondary thiamine-phosphate synthase enzyme